MSEPSEKTLQSSLKFLEGGEEELKAIAKRLEESLPQLQIALDKIEAAKKITRELLQREITI